MPRGNQAKMAESKKRTASTKSVSDEELSPKRAKALKDANKTGILDKCLLYQVRGAHHAGRSWNCNKYEVSFSSVN